LFTKAINSDALFMKYIAAGREMIGESMRNPKIVRGATEALNRATAQASLEFAEAQVYMPERQAFDWWINRFIMPELGVLFWNFRSNSPVSTDLDAAKAVVDLTKAGVLTPAEARRLTARVFNVDLRRINAEWVNQPLQLTLAGLLMTDGGGVSTGETERNVEGMLSGSAKRMLTTIRAARKSGADVVEEVAKLFELRAMAVEGERKQANQDFAHTQDVDEALAGEPEVITLKWPGSIDRYFTPAKKESENE
jgi:capsid portal protein